MRLIALLAVAILAGCGGEVTPVATTGATQVPAGTTATTPSPSPATLPPTQAGPSPALPVAQDVVPPRDAMPAKTALGIQWRGTSQDDGYGTAIARGPAGWLMPVLYDGEVPAYLRLRRSGDLARWTEYRPSPAIAGGVNWALAATDGAYVLAGLGAWRSTDGRQWEAVIPASQDNLHGVVTSVASDRRTFVAWHPGSAAPGVWVSADGHAWTATSLPGAAAVIVDAVAPRVSGGFVAAGRAGGTTAMLTAGGQADAPPHPLPGTQAVWVSDDGASWTAVPMGVGFEDARITAVAAEGPGGGMLAAGTIGRADEAKNIEPIVAIWRLRDDAVWRSPVDPSGRSPDVWGWQRLEGPALSLLDERPGVAAVLATPERWLVVGTRFAGDARGYSDRSPAGVLAGSEDGVAWWASAPLALGTDKRAYAIDAVAQDPDRIVLLTNTGVGMQGNIVRLWVSP